MAHPKLGLPYPLFQRTAALQEQQTERKRREWLRPQEKLRGNVNSRISKFEIRNYLPLLYALCQPGESFLHDGKASFELIIVYDKRH
jgi:hypothetical protein